MMQPTRQSATRICHWLLYPLSFFDPGGRGLSASTRSFRSIRATSALSSLSSSFPAAGFISSEYLATPAIVLQTLGPVFLVGNAVLLATRLGYQAIPEVLTNGTVLPEVDQHRRPAAFLIGYELDSGHSSILPAKKILPAHRTVPQRYGQGGRFHSTERKADKGQDCVARTLLSAPTAECCKHADRSVRATLVIPSLLKRQALTVGVNRPEFLGPPRLGLQRTVRMHLAAPLLVFGIQCLNTLHGQAHHGLVADLPCQDFVAHASDVEVRLATVDTCVG